MKKLYLQILTTSLEKWLEYKLRIPEWLSHLWNRELIRQLPGRLCVLWLKKKTKKKERNGATHTDLAPNLLIINNLWDQTCSEQQLYQGGGD